MMKRILLAFALLVASLASAQAQYIAPYAGAVTRTYNDKLSDAVSVLDFIPPSLHAGIRAGTSTTDVSSYLLTMQSQVPIFTPFSCPAGQYDIGAGSTALTGRLLYCAGATFTGGGSITGATFVFNTSDGRASLDGGGLGGSQAAAAANSVPVFPGSGGAAVPTTLASIFSSPTPLGDISPNTVRATMLGIGKTPSVFLDIAWPNSTAAYEDSEVPWLVNIIAGQAANPITSVNPVMGISQYSASTTDTTGGQNATLYIESTGNNSGSSLAQTNALTAKAKQIGTGDVVGGYFVATQAGGQSAGVGHVAYGFFSAVGAMTAKSSALGGEIQYANLTGTNYTVNSTFENGVAYALDLAADGNSKSSGAILIRKNNACAGCGNDTGINIESGGADASSIFNRANSTDLFVDLGAHTNGIYLTGTYSGNSIIAPNFTVNGTTGVPTAPQFVSTIAIGTAPFVVTSTTLVTNLYAAKADVLATTRAIYGNNFDGSAALTQIIASTYGGTGNGFTKFSGPATAEKTFTLPNANATLLYDGGNLGTPSAGVATNLTGTASSLTAGTATNAVNVGVTNDTTTNATMNLAWVTANTGNLPIKVSSTGITYNPSTKNLVLGGGDITLDTPNQSIIFGGSAFIFRTAATGLLTISSITSGDITVAPASGTTNITGTLKVSAIASASGNELLCYNTTGGVISYASSVLGCVPSAMSKKNMIDEFDGKKALKGIERTVAGIYTYKKELGLGSNEMIGLYADQICEIDERLCSRDAEGRIDNYDKYGALAIAFAGIKQLKADNDNLRQEFEQFKRRVSR